MLVISTCFWRANSKTATASQGYAPFWVDRLARAWQRNLTTPHRFVCFTDRAYDFQEKVEQLPLASKVPGWESMIEPFQLSEPSIICGLDTVIVGNCDALADYCLTADRIALPLSPGKPFACNAIVLKPEGHTDIYTRWSGENDMEWLRAQPHEFIDTRFPGWVQSYKCHVRPRGLQKSRVVYMHGRPKMDDLSNVHWVKAHWR